MSFGNGYCRGKNSSSALYGKAMLTGEADLQSEVAMAACLPPPLCWVCVSLVLQSEIAMAINSYFSRVQRGIKHYKVWKQFGLQNT
ncbi:hypothetical protein DVH24_042384 [Malus domestica]|uniref:Uncharacterized protein n=1 Tax=Malus domestica TaxID=3750 RepID=A0A498J386_MALDO|nr:hypothetical protein DVH24_042384 [Malus domestica]